MSAPKTLLGPDLAPPKEDLVLLLRTAQGKQFRLNMDPEFSAITEHGGLVFRNILRILKDPSVTAHKDTDTGFL